MASGYTVAVNSAKGGVGKSLIATNLAVALASFGEARIALVDLDLQFGNTELLLEGLGRQHNNTIADLVSVAHELPDHLELAFQKHSSGIQLLLPPRQTRHAFEITGAFVVQLLSALRAQFDWIVCDCPPRLDDPTMQALVQSDLVLIVVTQDLPCLDGTRRLLEFLRSSRPAPLRGQIGIVVNQCERWNPFDARRLEEWFQARVLAALPQDRNAVWRNVTRGVPMVLNESRGMAEGIRRLAARIYNLDLT